MTERENSICSTGAPEEVWDRLYELDQERMEALGKAYTGVKCITGENSRLIFSDPTIAQLAETRLGSNPLDWLGFKPFEDCMVEGLYLDMPRDEFFGGEESRTFHKGLRKDANLYTLLATIEEGFETTGDTHHTFFEGFETEHMLHPFEGPVLIVRPILGS